MTGDLAAIACRLVGEGRGILAMDESNGTCNKRFSALDIPQTAAMRRAWRALILTTPNLGDSISGAILYDETIRQATTGGVPFITLLHDAGIIPGIKVDTGAKALAGHGGEMVTEGLDGLRERLHDYFDMGARFAKWRAVITLGDAMPDMRPSGPSGACLEANAHALARYAALCQEAGLVPIVEPEVLMTGDHTLERCQEVTERTLRCVFTQLAAQGVRLEGMILKPNMVLPGLDSPLQRTTDEVAAATIASLRRVVPAAVAGIAFLSGGQSALLASRRLNAMNRVARDPAARVPWPLAFSFARAIQQPALNAWRGLDANVAAAQTALAHRARCNKAAVQGAYSDVMEPA